MGTTRAFQLGMVAVGIAVLLTAWPATRPRAQPAPPVAVQIDHDDIGGVVTSKKGPEAGVWVIAETTDLGTRFAKIAVTDERGRYVIPDLPRHWWCTSSCAPIRSHIEANWAEGGTLSASSASPIRFALRSRRLLSSPERLSFSACCS
jgi:hypothetical protein